ncbi:MAG: tRNA lysidine(34) synthetase TilS [Bacteroidetes bacterium]|nr:MAG: tRNA lysidine(34) synthetase TilS [Bacteroidota bacterium]
MPALQQYLELAYLDAGLQLNDEVLLACSGGRDSMVMLELLHRMGCRFQVAHANFQLRGEASEGDEAFVQERCTALGIPFHSKRFPTQDEAHAHHESIQMAARRLRYQWLFSLAKDLGCKRVITAHHGRDQAETLLLNLMRGSGPVGLQAMLPDNGKVLRPLLFCPYEQVEVFAKREYVQFREDASNSEQKYRRNFLRHSILKNWEERFPGTIDQLVKSTQLMQESNAFTQRQLKQMAEQYVVQNDAEIKIDYSLFNNPDAHLLMRHVLEPFGLKDQSSFILKERARPGAIFSSETHVLVADRGAWVIREVQEKPSAQEISPEELVQFGDYHFVLRKREADERMPLASRAIVLSDTLVSTGLYVRSWQEGDKMRCFGMQGQKKLSDILIDAKIDRPTKERIPVVCNSEGTILWLAGIRSAEALRLSDVNLATWVLELVEHDR